MPSPREAEWPIASWLASCCELSLAARSWQATNIHSRHRTELTRKASVPLDIIIVALGCYKCLPKCALASRGRHTDEKDQRDRTLTRPKNSTPGRQVNRCDSNPDHSYHRPPSLALPLAICSPLSLLLSSSCILRLARRQCYAIHVASFSPTTRAPAWLLARSRFAHSTLASHHTI